MALGACFCVLLLGPVRVLDLVRVLDPVRVPAAFLVPAAFFVPVVVSGDVLAPEAPLEDAVVRPAAGFLAGLVGWSVLMATTVRRVLRAV